MLEIIEPSEYRVEIVPQAIDDAKQNAKLNNMKIRQNIQQAIYDSLPDTKDLPGDNE